MYALVSREQTTTMMMMMMITFSAIGLSLFLTWTLFELHLTHVTMRRADTIDVVLLVRGEVQNVECLLYII